MEKAVAITGVGDHLARDRIHLVAIEGLPLAHSLFDESDGRIAGVAYERENLLMTRRNLGTHESGPGDVSIDAQWLLGPEVDQDKVTRADGSGVFGSRRVGG